MEQTAENRAVFETMAPARALLKLAVPTIISQLVALIYNLADTFFIGKTDDPLKVAAATIASALMFILIATGVGLIIFRAKGLPVTSEGQKELEASREAAKDPLFGAISGLLWVIILAAYFIISFKTGAWYITWLAFPIGGAVEGLHMRGLVATGSVGSQRKHSAPPSSTASTSRLRTMQR